MLSKCIIEDNNIIHYKLSEEIITVDGSVKKIRRKQSESYFQLRDKVKYNDTK